MTMALACNKQVNVNERRSKNYAPAVRTLQLTSCVSLQWREKEIRGQCRVTRSCNRIGAARSSMIMAPNPRVDVKERRSKNYAPTIWNPQLIRSFKSPYNRETHGNRLEKLKEDVRIILALSMTENSHVETIKLIDTIQQLGIASHFEKEIKDTLNIIYPNISIESDLSTVALAFRILRSFGFSINSNVFNKFIDKNGTFFDNLSKNVEGLIALYEASYLGMEGEDVLEEAKNFSKKHLTLLMKKTEISAFVKEQIRESIEVPLHWRMPRADMRGFIVSNERSKTMNKVLLELAKLDFNLTQSVYLKELQELAKTSRSSMTMALACNKQVNVNERRSKNYAPAVRTLQLTSCVSLQWREKEIRGQCRVTRSCNRIGAARSSMIMAPNPRVDVKERRSKNYAPTIWNPQLIRSFKSPYNRETHGNRLEKLKEDVRIILALSMTENSHVETIKLIDTIQQLGIASHFEKEIKDTLNIIYPNISIESDLSTVALAFRILRSFGFSINSNVFNKFIDKNGTFFDNLSKNVEGLIALYEASYLGMEGEDVLEEAKNFSKKHLTLLMKKTEISAFVKEQIRESIEVPLHWRMPRADIRGFIVSNERSKTMNKVLLELAKLDFNLTQSVYLKELQELANWWEELNFKESLPFARDRLTEVFFYVVGSVPADPQFSRCRINVAKWGTLATILDDIYDTYGLFDELQRLTDVIDRWDVNAMEELPEYMRIWCSAMLDHVDETIQDGFNDLNLDIRPYIQAQWKTLTKAYLLEAKWMHKKEMPSFYEYIENGWVSFGISMSLAYIYFALIRDSKLTANSITEYFELWHNSDLVRLPCLIARLLDDLKSSKSEMEIGEIANSVQCYIVEKGVSEEEAIDHMRGLINHSWRKINKLLFQNPLPFPECIMNTTLDQTRSVVRMYKHVDFFGAQAMDNKNIGAETFFNPI